MSLVFLILALICFALAALNMVVWRLNLIAAGLFFLFLPQFVEAL